MNLGALWAIRERYRTTMAAIAGRARTYLDRAWIDVEANLSDAALARFADLAATAADGAQHQVAVASALYLALHAGAATDQTVTAPAVDRATVTTAALRGTPGFDVWSRPGSTVWAALSRGSTVTAALAAGAARAHALSAIGLELAHTHTARAALAARPDVVGFQRAPGDGACDLCRAATEQYGPDELLPIHGHCFCVVDPIYRDQPPVPVLAPDRAVTGHPYTVHTHGEIGPMLARKGQTFTGPSDIETT